MKVYLSAFIGLFFCQNILAAFDSSNLTKSNKALKILRITPAGKDVPAKRQIVIKFNQAMVAIGKMEVDTKSIPISISPEVQCEWRWLNSNTLACQLNNKTRLKYSTRYKLSIKPGFKSLSQKILKRTKTHTFITQRPRTNYSYIKKWLSPSTPLVELRFNQRVLKESVKKHVFFISKKKKYAVEVKPYHSKQAKPYQQFWNIQPLKKLPKYAKVKLMIEPGIVSKQGTMKGIEKRKVINFHTFPNFKYMGLRCYSKKNKWLKFKSQLIKSNKCRPEHGVQLRFSAPIDIKTLIEALEITPKIKGYDKKLKAIRSYNYGSLRGRYYKGHEYTFSIGSLIKANTRYKISINQNAILDLFNRKLKNNLKSKFSTAHYKPYVYPMQTVSIVEKSKTPVFPFTSMNIKQLDFTYKVISAKKRKSNQKLTHTIRRVWNQTQIIPLDLNKILNGESGLIIGRWKSKPKTVTWGSPNLGKSNSFFTQVTPFQVHLKLGYYNSLAWVTRIDNGQIVKGAKIEIINSQLDDLALKHPLAFTTKTNEFGIATLPSKRDLDPKNKLINNYSYKNSMLYLRVEHQGDIAYLPINHYFKVNNGRRYYRHRYYYQPSNNPNQYIKAWGFSAQGVYKLGDTIQFKLLVRDQGNFGLIKAPRNFYKLLVKDPLGKTVYSKHKIKLNEFGSFTDKFKTSKSNAAGYYQFQLTPSFYNNSLFPMRVLVTDFKPASFHVKNKLDKKTYLPGDSLIINTQAKLHAGGPYANAKVRVSSFLSSASFIVTQPIANGFYFHINSHYKRRINQTIKNLDKAGKNTHNFKLQNNMVQYGLLSIESAVADDRGKFSAKQNAANYAGLDFYVGVKHKKWLMKENEKSSLMLLVANAQKEIVKDIDIEVNIQYRQQIIKKTKGAHGSTLSKIEYKWLDTSECTAKSALTPVNCNFTPKRAGYYRFIATVKNSKGQVHTSKLERWATGKERIIWRNKSKFSATIVPEKKSYRVGDTARVMIQNPFPGAKALVSIERLGVIDSWVTDFKYAVDTLEFKIKDSYLPGFYLSVVLISPKGDQSLTNKENGSPIRIGSARIPVTGDNKSLFINIKTEKNEYQPRDKIKANIQVSNHEKKNTQAELAIAVVDQSVYDLISSGKIYYDAHAGLYKLSQLNVTNYNLLVQLLKKKSLEEAKTELNKRQARKKILALKSSNREMAQMRRAQPSTKSKSVLGRFNSFSGGDRVEADEESKSNKKPAPAQKDIKVRSLFKFLSYWNGSLKTDKSGKAKINFTAPDNLTAWKIIVVANDKKEKLGLGEGKFIVNQALEIRSALPNQVTAGDEFQARFIVMNRTKQTQTVKIDISATGQIKTESKANTISKTFSIKAEPFKRNIVSLKIASKLAGKIQFKAVATSSSGSDALQLNLQVRKQKALHVGATYGTSTQQSISEAIKIPNDIRTGVGKIQLNVSPTVIANLSGAFKYLKNYPYICWEQKLTKGVMASHYQNLRAYLPKSFVWPGSKSLSDKTISMAQGHQAPNGGMVYYRPENKYVSPYLSAYTALAFTWFKQSTHKIPVDVENKLHRYLLKLIKKKSFPGYYSSGMKSTVHAVALNALAYHRKIKLSTLKLYMKHTKDMSLFGKSHFLKALTYFPGSMAMQKKVVDEIQSFANETGGKYIYTETLSEQYSHLLSSSLRSQCSILSARLAYESQKKVAATDIPFKLVRTITQSRKRKSRWENTQENMFCMNALIEYSRIYEKSKPNYQITSFIDTQLLGQANFKSFRDKSKSFSRAITAKDPGKSYSLKIDKKGKGRYYYSAQVHYSPKKLNEKPINSGISVNREYSVERDGKWIILKSPMQLKQGELVRVDLYVSLAAARHFVVVNDAVPGGLEPVNTQLATASKVDAAKAKATYAGGSFWFKFNNWRSYGYSFWSFYHREILHHSVRYYSEYLPAGNYHLSYVAQAIAPGKFTVMPTHAEEMYDPDVFGKSPTLILNVSPKEQNTQQFKK